MNCEDAKITALDATESERGVVVLRDLLRSDWSQQRQNWVASQLFSSDNMRSTETRSYGSGEVR